MTESDANHFSNQVILKLLERDGLLGPRPLQSEASAKKAAKALAEFRKTLVEELKGQ